MELIFEKSKAGRGACLLSKNELKNRYSPDTSLLRETPARLPQAA